MGRATAVLAGAALGVALVSCGGDDSVTPAPEPGTSATSSATSSAPPPSASPTRTPSAEPEDDGAELPPGTSRQTRRHSGAWDLVLSDVRVGEHAGFDRVVLEFTGAGAPGWTVAYVKRARLDGSGRPVRLDGGSVLDVYASGTTAPAPGYYDGPRRLDAGAAPVREVFVGGTFEGYTQVLVGIDGRRPSQVFALTDPPRLVLDVST